MLITGKHIKSPLCRVVRQKAHINSHNTHQIQNPITPNHAPNIEFNINKMTQ